MTRRIDGRPVPIEDVLEALVQLRRQRRPCALCTVVGTAGSSPRKPGAKMIVLPDGGTIGTIGGGTIELEVLNQAVRSIADGVPTTVRHHLTRELGMCCGGEMEVFVEPQAYAPRLHVFGAGHTARPLCRVAAAGGFEVTVIDARETWATEERFPDARRVLCEEYEDAIGELTFSDEDVFAVVMTHDHAVDQRIVELLHGRPLRYLGVIGSVRKREKMRQRLGAFGFDEAEIERVRIPTGLDIGAVRPEEIAVSIVAEMIRVRHQGDVGTAVSMSSLGKGYRPKEREVPELSERDPTS